MPDKQKVILFVAKYLSYGLNLILGAALAWGIYFWVSTLIASAK